MHPAGHTRDCRRTIGKQRVAANKFVVGVCRLGQLHPIGKCGALRWYMRTILLIILILLLLGSLPIMPYWGPGGGYGYYPGGGLLVVVLLILLLWRA